MHTSWPCLLAAVMIGSPFPASAQWNLTGSAGYSTSGSRLGGGTTYAIGVARTGPGPHWGVEIGEYNLGHQKGEFPTLGFPGEPPGIVRTDASQGGWRFTASLDLLTAGRFSWMSSLGYYRFTSRHTSEILDTTRQQVIRPRIEFGGSASGAGLATGFRLDLLQVSRDVGFSIEATVHGVGLRSTADEDRYSFFHYFSVGGKVRLRI